MDTRIYIIKIEVASEDRSLINQLQHDFINRVMEVPAEVFTLKVVRRTVTGENEPLE